MKVFQTILIIYLNISLTSLIKIVQSTVNTDVKKPCEDFYEYACSNYSQEISQKLEDQLNKELLSQLTLLIQDKPPNLETFYDKIITYFEACNNKTSNCIAEYGAPFLHLMENESYNFWPLLGILQSYGLNNVILNHTITRNVDNTLDIHLSSVDILNDEPLDSDNPVLLKVLESFGHNDENVVQSWLNNNLKWRAIAIEYNQMKYKELPNKNLKKIDLKLYTELQSYLENLLEAEIDNLSVITIEEKYYMFLINTEDQIQIYEYLFIKFLYYLERDAVKNQEPLECIKDLRNKFDLGLNYLYYENYFQHNEDLYIIPVFIMVERIIDVMSEQFKSNHLNLSSQQIEFLLKKLQTVQINIGNMPDNFHFTQINTFYQDIPQLSNSNYCKNHLILLKQRFREALAYMQNQTYSLGTDSTTATTPSLPFYVLNKNMIVIPFSSFQFPLFHQQQTPLEQLSVFGFILAHELTHAIDTWGLQFDHQGSELTNPSDILEHANFTASVKCMHDQQPTEDIHERIADLFAVRVVYHTYLEYNAKGGEEDWIKEFFENLAQFFCGDNKLQYIYHDSDPVRLQQIVKNFSPFDRAFACPAGSAMSSKTKCRLY